MTSYWGSIVKSQIPLAAVPEMVYYIAGSHSHSESAKIWHEFRLTPENNRKELAHDYSERKDSTAGRPRVSQGVLVKPLSRETVTKSGIVLPDTAKEKPQEGEILAVGPGKVLDNGKLTKPEVSVGQKVLFAKYAGTEVKQDGEEYLILRESDIMGIVE